jgi:DNA invertase Pin-like site-specific DNA recombinase
LHESLDTTTPGGRVVFHVFAVLAEFIRELIVQGTHEGLAAVRARVSDTSDWSGVHAIIEAIVHAFG